MVCRTINSWTVEMATLMRSMSSSFKRAPKRDLPTIAKVIFIISGEVILDDRRQNFELLPFKTRLNQAALCSPGFPFGREKTFAQEMPHAFLLDFGLVVVLRIRFQHMLNDCGICGDNGFFDAPEIEAKRVAMKLGVLRENPHRIARHRARIEERAGTGDGGHAVLQGHASLSRRE